MGYGRYSDILYALCSLPFARIICEWNNAITFKADSSMQLKFYR